MCVDGLHFSWNTAACSQDFFPERNKFTTVVWDETNTIDLPTDGVAETFVQIQIRDEREMPKTNENVK